MLLVTTLLATRFLSPDADGAAGGAPAAPAAPAPAAPAPAAPAAPAEPSAPARSLTDQPSAVPMAPTLEDALSEFRRHHSEDQPRDEAGKFAPGGQATDEPGTPAPDGVADANAGGDGEPTPDGAEPPPEGGAGEPPAAERVALPGRQPSDPDVEIEVDDPAVAERLRQLKNGFLRGEEVRASQAATAQDRAELDAVKDQVMTDPVGFVHDQLSPDLRVELAMQILSTPDALQLVAPELEALLDPERAQLVRAQLETRRYQLREALRGQREERVRVETQVQAIRRAVEALVPDGWDEDRAQLFTKDCLADLGRWVRSRGVSAVDPADVPLALAARLRSVGLNPVQAADQMLQRLASPATSPGSPGTPAPGTARPRAPAAPRPVARAQPAQPTGAAFVAGRDRRQAAAVVAPAGAVAPAAGGLDVPPDATLDDVFDLLRKA